MAELRHVEAELETVRQAHYAAGDALHAAQGLLAEAALEVSRLEERIRYVVEGRAARRAALAELTAQSDAVWQQRQQRGAGRDRDDRRRRSPRADDEAAALAAQAEEQAGRCRRSKTALRGAQAASNEQRAEVAEVQQQIQVLAAESRNVEEQARTLQGAPRRLAGERQGAAARRTPPGSTELSQHEQRAALAAAAKAKAALQR